MTTPAVAHAAAPPRRPLASPLEIARHLRRHGDLLVQLARREVLSRHKGAFLGLFWVVVQPLLMLAIYTFVFSVIFKMRWGTAEGGRLLFALTLFAGLTTFGVFSELISSAPALVLANQNYVKKVVFPLEILPAVRLASSLVFALVSVGILLLALLALGMASWTWLLLPVAWLPMVLWGLGLAWFLAALGVFLRDLQALVGLLVTVLFFLSPIFYPLSALPPDLRALFRLNPVAVFVEDARRVLVFGLAPQWPWTAAATAAGLVVVSLGYAFFMRSKPAFADVL
jgi:lipopolysaccharide transport system permease protein